MAGELLIVDDEQIILDLLSDFFRDQGYSVTAVSEPETALEVARQKNIDVVISDLLMPSMEGVEFCKAFREINSLAFVIALTGYSKLFELSNCRAAGFDDYFTKPADLEALHASVKFGLASVSRWAQSA